MSDSCSHVGLPWALLGVTVGLSLTVLSGERDLEMLSDAVVSEIVTLIPLTPETAECVSQSLDWSLVLDIGEAVSMLISAAPSSLLALLVMGADMLCTSCGFSFCRRCGMGNLNLVVPPIVRMVYREAPERQPSLPPNGPLARCPRLSR